MGDNDFQRYPALGFWGMVSGSWLLVLLRSGASHPVDMVVIAWVGDSHE